jgi:hypothetical protein
LNIINLSALFGIILGFSFCIDTSKSNIDGKYLGVIPTNTLEFVQNGQEIKGYHCFVNSNGKRIDCCLKVDGIGESIRLTEVSDGIYKGIMHSCYDEEKRSVLVLLNESKLKYVLIDNNHDFIQDTTEFILVK